MEMKSKMNDVDIEDIVLTEKMKAMELLPH